MRAVVLSFHWKLIHDGITMQYIGLMLLDGVLPYRDIFDMNFPLTYWIHAVGITLLGKGDIATRSYDLLWCYFGAFAIAACIWRQNRALAIGAGLCFLMLHIGNGYMNQLQRDMYMAVFLSGGIFFVLIHPRPVIAGVLIGAACSIKPVAAIFALMMLLVHRPKNMIAYAVGLAIIPILSMSWMVGVGIFDEFLDVLLNFTLPVFASQAFEDTFQFRPEIPSYAVVAMILHVIAWRRKIFARKSLILIMGLIYGLLHYYLQRKGYNQHLYPFWAMVCVMMGVNLTLLAQQAFYSVWIGIALILTALFVSTPSTLWQKSAWFHDTPLIFMSESLEKEWMRENFPDPGEQVQILEDIFGTAWRLAYHYGWHPNMRFMYPFVLYAGKDHPVMKRYRQELVNSIIAAPPKYILLSSNSWPQYKRRVYKEFEGQPGLDYVLKQHYVVVIENRQTKLWQRKY